jgi:L,D-peptidoglycan transpeptidase YkuD (ErfK/YbiS/YcfS/YnhG family)
MSSTEKAEAAQAKPKGIEVVVTFPIGQGGPFQKEEDPATPVGAVLAEAMSHFQVQPQPGSNYYLTHDGTREDDSLTVGGIAAPANAVKFTLVKELVQG